MAEMTLERYEAKFTKGGPDECWPWQERSRDKDGYGLISWRTDGQLYTRRAHRFGWQMRFGPIPDGMMIRHTCDNPPCQNPTHWLLGNNQDNMNDMKSRGRAKGPGRGSDHYKTRLTDDLVREIRLRYTAESITHQALADEYGVGRESISKIIRRERWTHI